MKFVSVSLLLFFAFFAQTNTVPIEREVYAMGTVLRITLYETDREKAIQESEKLLSIIEETEAQLSTWRETSEISRFNRHPVKEPFIATTSLFQLMQKLQLWSVRTEGYFDPTVGELTRVWGIHASFRIPNDSELRNALSNSGFQHSILEPSTNSIVKDRLLIMDAGGFGKGEGLDRALATAKKDGYGSLMLDLGGQIAVQGTPPGEEHWSVPIAHPADRAAGTSIIYQLSAGSLSTSAGSERDGIVNGKRIGHILNPKTGYPVPSFGSVTVWRMSALEADILSTALYAMGPEKGFEWALRNDVAACFLIVENGKITPRITPSFGRHCHAASS